MFVVTRIDNRNYDLRNGNLIKVFADFVDH